MSTENIKNASIAFDKEVKSSNNSLGLNDRYSFCMGYVQGKIDAGKEYCKRIYNLEQQIKEIIKDRDKGEVLEPEY